MTYQVLARKWRPRHFAELVGQEHVVRALQHAIDQNRVHHGFLFTGTRGVGKTTIARILAKCLNCEAGMSSTPCGQCSTCKEIDEGRYVDLMEVDAASRSGVDGTRELMDNVHYAPSRGRYKVYLIDEVHMFSTASFNALLKTLEEPPPHVKFLLATTDPQKIPVTVLSRCLQFNLKRLPRELIQTQLDKILSIEGIEGDNGAVRELARAADGSMRDALSLLDQAIAHGGGRLLESDVRQMLGTLDRRHLHALIDALHTRDAPALLERVAEMAGDATDFAEALSELVAALQRLAVIQVLPGSLAEDEPDRDWWAQKAADLAAEDIQLYYQIGIVSRRDLPFAPDPRSGFEMALIRMVGFAPMESVAGPSSGTRGPNGGTRGPDGGTRGTGATAAEADSSVISTGARSATAIDTAGGEPASRAPRPTVERTVVMSAQQSLPESPPIPEEFDVGEGMDRPPPAPGIDQITSQMAGDAVNKTANQTAPVTKDDSLVAGVVRSARMSGQAPASALLAHQSAVSREPGPCATADVSQAVTAGISQDERGSGTDWLDLVESLPIQGFARELALNCIVRTKHDDRMVLALSSGHSPLNNTTAIRALQSALAAHFGCDLSLEIVLEEPDSPTPAQIRAIRQAARQAAAVQAMQTDPLVQQLNETFGAELIEASVRPNDATG